MNLRHDTKSGGRGEKERERERERELNRNQKSLLTTSPTNTVRNVYLCADQMKCMSVTPLQMAATISDTRSPAATLNTKMAVVVVTPFVSDSSPFVVSAGTVGERVATGGDHVLTYLCEYV